MRRPLFACACVALACLAGLPAGAQRAEPRPLATPTPAQRAWQDLGMGLFIHFAPNTWQDREYDDLSTPLASIDPSSLDVSQWVDAAEAMGARYIVFVAKHAGGFCMWQTTTTSYGIAGTPWRGGKGDVLGELAAACARRGMALGVYLSPQDAKQGAGGGGRTKSPDAQEAYNRIYRQQLTEVLSRYGRIAEVWFDGSLVVPVGDILAAHAPEAMVFQGPHATIRWVGNEMGFAPYPAWNTLPAADAKTGIATAMHGDPDGEAWRPNEVDVSLRRPNWFWSTTNHVNILSVPQLLEIYYRSVGRGANLLVNVTPDRTGLIPAADVARLREFGTEVRRRFGHPVAETTGAGPSLELRLPAPTRIDHVILQEDISKSERVREYVLEGRANGVWSALGSGSAIGQVRIQPVGPATVDAIRVTASRAAAAPAWRRLAAFATGSAPPPTWNEAARVWASDEVGRWENGAASIDLAKAIDRAGQYRLRFVGDAGRAARPSRVELRLDGILQENLVAPDPSRADSRILTIPGLGLRPAVTATIDGAPAGTVLLQRIQ